MQLLPDHKELHARIWATGGIHAWPSSLKVQLGYNVDDVREYCVNDEAWQERRLLLKGKPTHEKLRLLVDWWEDNYQDEPKRTEIQVGNYLGALRRGGQLDDNNVVRKWL